MRYIKAWMNNQSGWSLETCVCTFMLIALVTIVFWGIGCIQKRKRSQCFWAWVLTCYLIMVFVFTVFARNPGEKYEYELELFWSYRRGMAANGGLMICEIILNILMLLPIGLLLPVLISNRLKKKISCGIITVFTGFVISATIEILQLVLKRGLFEFDDMFHNTLGAAIGVLIYYGLSKAKMIICRKNL